MSMQVHSPCADVEVWGPCLHTCTFASARWQAHMSGTLLMKPVKSQHTTLLLLTAHANIKVGNAGPHVRKPPSVGLQANSASQIPLTEDCVRASVAFSFGKHSGQPHPFPFQSACLSYMRPQVTNIEAGSEKHSHSQMTFPSDQSWG